MRGMGHVKHGIRKIQVQTEPGLTTAQLMLTNDDLRPGMIFVLFPSRTS